MDHVGFLEIADEVRERLASCLRGAQTMFMQTTDDDSVSNEEAATPAQRKKGIKSGMLHMADTLVLKRNTWPHEVVYTSTGQPAANEEMSSVPFVN